MDGDALYHKIAQERTFCACCREVKDGVLKEGISFLNRYNGAQCNRVVSWMRDRPSKEMMMDRPGEAIKKIRLQSVPYKAVETNVDLTFYEAASLSQWLHYLESERDRLETQVRILPASIKEVRMDQCKHCVVRGNHKKCVETECSYHELWYTIHLNMMLEKLRVEKTHLESERDRLKMQLEREQKSVNELSQRVQELGKSHKKTNKFFRRLAKHKYKIKR